MQAFNFFDKLQEKSKKELLEASKFIKAPAGTVLYSQGDICVDILFLTKGESACCEAT